MSNLLTKTLGSYKLSDQLIPVSVIQDEFTQISGDITSAKTVANTALSNVDVISTYVSAQFGETLTDRIRRDMRINDLSGIQTAFDFGNRAKDSIIGVNSIIAGGGDESGTNQANVASALNSFAQGGRTVAGEMYSHAEGHYSKALGEVSHAEGGNCVAAGKYSHAEGNNTSAIGQSSHTEGQYTLATGVFSHAEGSSTKAIGEGSHAEGVLTEASGVYSHACGVRAFADHGISYVWNGLNDANEYHSQKEGSFCINPVDGISGFYIGDKNIKQIINEEASTYDSDFVHISGDIMTGDLAIQLDGSVAPKQLNLTIGGDNSSGSLSVLGATNNPGHDDAPTIFVGCNEYPDGSGSNIQIQSNNKSVLTIEHTGSINETLTERINRDIRIKDLNGNYTAVNFGNRSNSSIVGTNSFVAGGHAEDGSDKDQSNTASALNSFAQGGGTVAGGMYSHAEGHYSEALGENSHAEGGGTVAEGKYSHAEGNGTKTGPNAQSAHAEGNKTQALQQGAHAEGSQTIAQNYYTHAEGNMTSAIGSSSHAEGYKTLVTSEYSHTEGRETSASGKTSHAAGFRAASDKDYSWTWNGDDTKSDYASISAGSFCINPKSEIEGFYIGDRNLKQIINTEAPAPDLTPYATKADVNALSDEYVKQTTSVTFDFTFDDGTTSSYVMYGKLDS